ncbi:MAG: MBG domain-containing protein [Bacteroidota bacterium]
MKKIYLFVIMLFISISSFSQTEVFDWFFPSDLSSTPPSQNITVAGITATYFSPNTIVSDPDGQGGPMVLVSGPQSSTNTSVTITFSSPVDLISLEALEFNPGRSWVFTPTGGSNSTVTSSIAEANFTSNVRTLVSLNWIGVTGFTITRSGGGSSAFPVDKFLIAAASNNAPVIDGTVASQVVNDNSTIAPFSAITTTDTDGDNLSATITLDSNAKGVLSGTGLSGSGPYTISSRTPASLQSSLRALSFNPADNRSATSETTSFTVVINDGTDTDTDNTTTVISNSVAPTVTSVASPANGTYVEGQNIDFNISFSEAVDIATTGGTPQLAINIGGVTRYASYVIGSGNTTVAFRYVVQQGDIDTDGITVSNAISSNGGTIKDTGGKDANLTLNNVGSTSSVLVDTFAPVISSVSVPVNATYAAGQNLEFTVNFNENVNVTGTPQLAITVGENTRAATYQSGSGTSALVFGYTVQAGELDNDGITIETLVANGGSIEDTATNDADLTLNSVGTTTGVLVEAIEPVITSVAVPAIGSYSEGQNIDFNITFSEAVNIITIGGTPQLTIDIGGVTRQASYIMGSGNTVVAFRYVVQAGETDNDGIEVGSLATTGGAIQDAAGNDANLTLNNVGSTSSVFVDTTNPSVTSVAVPADDTYVVGQDLNFEVNFNENVNLTGAPQLAINIGSTTRQAVYKGGSGTGSLVFGYTVQAGELDTNGIEVGTLATNGGTIQDAASNDVNLTLNNIEATANVLVDSRIELAITGLTGVNKIYDGTTDATVSGTAALSGVVAGDEVNLSGTSIYTFSSSNVNTGIAIITTGFSLAGPDSAKYTLVQPTLSADISPADLTVTADSDQSKVFGNEDPVFTYTTSGFVAGEDGSILTGALSRVAGEDVGDYAIQQGNLTAGPNYLINYTSADFEIIAAMQTGLILANNSFTYDGEMKSLEVTGEAEDAMVVYDNNDRTDAGTYTVKATVTRPNYSTEILEATLVVNARPITLSAQEQSKVYGNTFTLDDTAFTVKDIDGDSVLPNGESIDAVNISSTTGIDASTTADVGTYADELVISSQTGSAGFNASNYDISYTEGDLVVNARLISITAKEQSKVYGNTFTLDNTAFTVTDTDGDSLLPNGESIDAVNISSATGVDASTTANVGTYADELVISSQTGSAGFDASNYDISYTDGDLVVNARPITLTAQKQSKVYGNTFTLDGKAFTVKDIDGDNVLPNGESIDVVSVASATGIDASTTADVGMYADELIISSPTGSAGFDISNYIFTYDSGDFEITPATQTELVFADKSFIYDTTTKSLVVTGQATDATVSYSNNDQTNAGIYEVAAEVTRPNYTTALLEATLTITKAEAVIPADAVQTFTYDGNLKNVTASLNHNETTLIYTPQQGYTNAGTYPVTVSAIETNNYQAASKEVSLEIENAEIEGVTFEDDTFTYDGETQSLAVTGLPAGATIDYENNDKINAGIYKVTATVSQENYNDLKLTADLIIEKAEAIITADAVQTFTYDGTFKNVGATLNHSETELTYTPQQGYIDAGTYKVTISAEETDNYLAASKEVSLVVEKAEIRGVTFEDETFIYDGTEHSIFVTGLPEGATVAYSNNGQTNAGTYTVTATVSKPGYKDLVLTSDLVIKKASQTITFNELEDRNQSTDEHFQLEATSTSGLPVIYSYTYETENPAATVGPRGFVRILGGGEVVITATQKGNRNYAAADPVVRTLTIRGGEARLNTVVINGTPYSSPSEDIYYLIGCGNSEDEVQIELEQNQGSSIDQANSFTMSTPAPGIYRETVTVTSEDGNSSQTYNITVEKNFNFEDIVIQKFNNVLLINNNPETNGGYKFVSYRWYKDGSVIGNGQYYSAGDNVDDQLDSNSEYYVVLETEDGEILRTCTSAIQLRSSLNVSLAPNPVSSGGTMELLADFPKEELETMQLSIHNLNGLLIKEMKSNRKITSITLPYTLQMGVYVLKIRTVNINRSVKFIIR